MWVRKNFPPCTSVFSSSISDPLFELYVNTESNLYSYAHEYNSALYGYKYFITTAHPKTWCGFKVTGHFTDTFRSIEVFTFTVRHYMHYYAYIAKALNNDWYYMCFDNSTHHIAKFIPVGHLSFSDPIKLYWRKTFYSTVFTPDGINKNEATNLIASKRDILSESDLEIWISPSRYGTYTPIGAATGKKRFGFLRLLNITDDVIYTEYTDFKRFGFYSSQYNIAPKENNTWILGDENSDGYWKYIGLLPEFFGDQNVSFTRIWNGSGHDPDPNNKIFQYYDCVDTANTVPNFTFLGYPPSRIIGEMQCL